MANKPYEQDVILDVDGQPVFDAMAIVNRRIEQFASTLKGLSKDTVTDVKAIQAIVDANIKALRQARSDLRTLQQDRQDRNAAFKAAEKQAKDVADVELRAGRDARTQGLRETRVYYGQQLREKRETDRAMVADEKALAKEVGDFEREQDRKSIASAREVAAARREARVSSLTAGAKGVDNLSDARAMQGANAAALSQLRQRRQEQALSDTAAANSTSREIEGLKQVGRALDSNIAKMERQAQLATSRLTGEAERLSREAGRSGGALVGSDVANRVGSMGTARALSSYKDERAAAEATYRALLSSTTATEKQLVAARESLQVANARVSAAERLSRAEEQAAMQAARVAAAQTKAAEQRTREEQRLIERSERQAQIDARGSLLGRAKTAAMNTALYGAVAGGGYAAFNVAQETVTNVIQLEDEFAKLQAISNSTDTEMQSLKGSIYGIGEGSRFAVDDLVKIAQTLAQAGVSASEMTNVLKSVTTLATASGSTPDEAVQLVTSALGAFQLQGSEAARVADLMTNALNRTKLTVQQVGQAIQYVGATAYEQNISLETLLATVGAVAQGGVRSGSTIGTGFRQFLVDLQTPTEKLRFEMERLGITQGDVDVKTRGLAAVLDTLKEKGFGATAAYDGLETRAAAFYLVAKNNTDVMDELQMSFAQQGAAAIANERAMNSLTAQWQRFKNILQEGFSSAMETPMKMLQNLLSQLSDRILQMRKSVADIKAAQAEGPSAYKKMYGDDTIGSYARYAANYDVGPGLQRGLEVGLNAALPHTGLATESGVGTWLRKLGEDAKQAGVVVEEYADQIKGANDAVDKHGQIVGEVDKELERLKTQQSSLIGNTQRSQAETVTLTSRFEGLSRFLGTTKNAYLDLVNAMNQYRGAESYLLGQSYGDAAVQQGRQNNLDKTSLKTTLGQIRGSGNLPPEVQAALGKEGRPEFSQQLYEAAQKVSESNETLGKLLYDAASLSSRFALGQNTEARARGLAGQATAASSPLGVEATSRQQGFESRLGGLSTMSQADRQKAGNGLTADINTYLGKLNTRLPNVSGDGRKFVQDMIGTLTGLLGQVTAAIKPSQEELKDAKRQQADKRREEAELAKRPKVSQGDIDSVGLALGLRLGSGTRTAAEQDALHARGVTRATSRTSDHVAGNGFARDFSVRGMTDEEAENKAATLRAQYRAKGIDAQVKFEKGGRNDGTGRHIHVGVRYGARMSADRSDVDADKQAAESSAKQVEIDQQDLTTKLKAVSKATTKETFDAAVASARTALSNVNKDLKAATHSDMASKGISDTSPEGKLRLAQMQDQIDQNVEDFNQKLSDRIIKSAELQIKAAQTAFDKAVAPAQRTLAAVQGQLTGLDNYSLRNSVPDYVKTLAQGRVSAANENVARAQYNALPSQIAAQQSAIASAQDAMNSNGRTEDAVAKLAQMNVELEKLKANRDALGAQLGAGGLIPTTVTQGLQQAIAAFQQTHAMSNTFSQDLIMNMGGALEQVNSGLTEMFTSILNGSQSALSAFGSFAKGIMSWMVQLAAKALATKFMSLLFSAVSSGVAPAVAPGASSGPIAPVTFAYNGGAMGYDSGGRVSNGSPAMDSVNANLAKDEWVIRKRAVDSVGHGFMAKLNKDGAGALKDLQGIPSISMKNSTSVPIYIIPPAQRPTLGKDDVLVILRDDMVSGEGRQLITHIARDS